MDKIYDDTPSQLVNSLNKLLSVLDIPLELTNPTDLTPTLLLAILESTLESRLPLPPQVRQARTPQAKIELVKIFLGVLANDILSIDLSQVDPRRLAKGEWDEVVYVGGLLLHVAKRSGLLGSDEAIVDVDADLSVSKILDDSLLEPHLPLSFVPKTPTTKQDITWMKQSHVPVEQAPLKSIMKTRILSPARSVQDQDIPRTPGPRPTATFSRPQATPFPRTRRKSSGQLDQTINSHFSSPPQLTMGTTATSPSVTARTASNDPDSSSALYSRKEKWLEDIDDSKEIIQLSKRPHSRNSTSSTRSTSYSKGISSETERVRLLNEKARLLEELARLKELGI